MAQYTINASHSSVFGMDVHARSVTVSGLDLTTGEMRTKKFNNNPAPADIATWMQKNFKGPHYAAYESGCTGFYLARCLRALGIDCDVIAITSIARSVDDKLQKTDKRDAKRLLSELISPMSTFTVVWVPDSESESARDLARARTDAVDSLKRVKQQLSALLLRHGHVWNEKTKTGKLKKTWGKEHWEWIESICFENTCTQEAFECYIQMVKECTERVVKMSKLVETHAQEDAFKPYVDAFICLKGIDVQTAFLATAQFGDFTRFKNGRSVSKWIGVVPRENSSGEHHVHGHITKAGDGHLRSALIEGTGAISRRRAGAKKTRVGQLVTQEVSGICNKANKRLKERYDHLTKDSKLPANKAKVAVVSELVRWMWVVGLEVQKQLCSAS